MISFMSKSIALFLYKKKIIDDEHLPVCEFGFELITATIVGFLLIVIVGLLFRELPAAILFYFIFVGVRYFTGGYHAASHFKCKLTLLGCGISFLTMLKFFMKKYTLLIHISLLIFYFISVLMFSPVEHPNAPLSAETKKRNRKTSIIMAIILICTILPGYKYFLKISIIFAVTLFIIALLIITPKIKERRDKHYEKAHS